MDFSWTGSPAVCDRNGGPTPGAQAGENGYRDTDGETRARPTVASDPFADRR